MKSIFTLFIFAISCCAAPKPVILDPSYQHDRFQTLPADQLREFRAYTVSFDGNDDNNQDGELEVWGVPEWVAYEVKRFEGGCVPTESRPPWFSDSALEARGVAPSDDSYRFTREWRQEHPDYYVRGHLCTKILAARLGPDAEWNTHTMLNAVPQRSSFNGGIWLDLEYLTGAWAQKYGSVYVVTGPVFGDRAPVAFIGDAGEFPVAVPEALFKIVIKESGDSFDVLAFLYPQIGAGYSRAPYDHTRYLTSVDEIEILTGLDFLTILPNGMEDQLEREVAQGLWSVSAESFLKACRD